MRLTELRRSIFIKLQTKKKKQNTDKSRSPKKSATSPKKSAASPKKSATSSKNRNANVESMIAEQDKTTEKSKSGETATRSEPSFRYERALELGPISEKILVIKVRQSGSSDGNCQKFQTKSLEFGISGIAVGVDYLK
jgi:hypothetical protein